MEEQNKKVYTGDSNPMDLVVSDSKGEKLSIVNYIYCFN